jgi:predicted phage baseplate assembly protein
MVTTVAGIDEGKVQNLAAAYGGSEEETLEEAKLRAPRAIKARCRAVTAEDFEMLAKETANVRRAKALPRFHPDFPDVDVPGAITLIVVPDSDSPTPTPSEGTLRSVCAYLDPRRLLTAELYVIPPTYQRVEVRTEVVVADDADLAEVREAIDAGLVEYFHPLRGGDDGLGWPFGGTILHSRVNHRVLSVSGVQSVPTLVLVLDGEEMPECRDVPLGRHALLYSGQHEIDAGYRFESLDE